MRWAKGKRRRDRDFNSRTHKPGNVTTLSLRPPKFGTKVPVNDASPRDFRPNLCAMAVLAIDAGTTGVTALIVDTHGVIRSRGYSEFPQHFPQPGWVEHSPDEIWGATLTAVRDALSATDEVPTALGITNQRETVVLWDRHTLQAPRRAIVWQDRRSAGIVHELRARAMERNIRNITGLGLDPYFSSTKLLWLSRNEPDLWDRVHSGKFAVGTVDSYLIARLTAGAVHVTDATNASRTQLLDLRTASWDDDLLDLFDVPRSALPDVVPSFGEVGTTDPDSFLGLRIPIAGIAGDQQAALFGQTAFSPGDTKCTYGTGAFILMNTGTRLTTSQHGLLTTIGLQDADGRLTYALEGSVFVAGAAVQWLRDGLGIIRSADEVEDLALRVDDSSGVCFVPALTGLGAPQWDPDARGTIIGITRGTTAAHIARATLDAIAFQVQDVVEAMVADTGQRLSSLRVDGGASANDTLMQLQADTLAVRVRRGVAIEMTGLGAAYLAGLGTGVWANRKELASAARLDREFEPSGTAPDRRQWQRAVDRSRDWAR